MNRRDILKYTALATGAVVSAPLAGVLLSGCQGELPEAAGGDAPAFFTQQEFTLLEELVDLILPETDSPAASAVGVHRMIDHMAGKVYPAEFGAAWRKEFEALAAHLGQAGFDEKTAEEKLKLLTALQRSEGQDAETARAGLLQLKQQSIVYYLSTKEIGVNFLNYLPVPGEYQACISLESAGGKAWAL